VNKPFPSCFLPVSKRVLVHNLSCGNYFNLQDNERAFCNKTRSETDVRPTRRALRQILDDHVTFCTADLRFSFQINIILLIIVVKKALSTHVMLARTQLQKIRAGIKAAIVSLPLLGITWTFGLLAFNSDTIFFKYMFAIFNSLQGLMIFVFHCALNKQVITGYSGRVHYFIFQSRRYDCYLS